MAWSSSRTISVRTPFLLYTIFRSHDAVNELLYPTGLISQVAEELWEVKDKGVRNLTKEGITIVDYKKLLMKESALFSQTFFVLLFS